MMPSSLRALLSGLIDYAGLFPPAKLPLADSLRNHLRYRREPEGWMLGRFICPAARLGELAALTDDLEAARDPLVVSALGRGGESDVAFMAGLHADLADIDACRRRHAGRIVVDVLEARLPPGDASSPRGKLLADSALLLHEAGLALFVEAPTPEGVSLLLRQLGKGVGLTPVSPGFKLRTGGLEARAFPSCEQVAQALIGCARERIPFKATAGLHHPFPRFDAHGVQARMHGFVNVFVAGAMAYALPAVGVETVQAILEDDEPSHFQFANPLMRWFDLELATEALAETRQSGMVSFGSCSFDEPRDDLRQLGLLPS